MLYDRILRNIERLKTNRGKMPAGHWSIAALAIANQLTQAMLQLGPQAMPPTLVRCMELLNEVAAASPPEQAAS